MIYYSALNGVEPFEPVKDRLHPQRKGVNLDEFLINGFAARGNIDFLVANSFHFLSTLGQLEFVFLL
jgi:hypothetical protein